MRVAMARIDLIGVLAHPVLEIGVHVPAARGDLHERDARLHQPAGQQAALAEGVAAVGVAEGRVFLLQVERLHPGREDHVRRLLVQRRVIRHPIRASRAGEPVALQGTQQSQPAGEPVFTGGQGHVGGRLQGVGHGERLVIHAQETRARSPAAVADRDHVRQVELRVAQLGGDVAAEVRVLDRARGHVAGVQVVRRPLVVAFLVGHGPDQGDLVHDLGRLVPALRNGDARHGGLDGLGFGPVGVVGLGVEGLHLARPARHPQQDAGHLPLAKLLGMHGHQVAEAQSPGAHRAQAQRLQEPADPSRPGR